MKKPTYSREPFEGYTHRFKVQFETSDPHYHNLDLYSDSGSVNKLMVFIEEKKTDKVISYQVIHTATREQDDMASKLIDSFE